MSSLNGIKTFRYITLGHLLPVLAAACGVFRKKSPHFVFFRFRKDVD